MDELVRDQVDSVLIRFQVINNCMDDHVDHNHDETDARKPYGVMR